ncbi:MAG TPA: prolipoprotein diacylglyceryl transferase [Bacteroidales bacterium]|nr:prolipoprotein diacylglyceryl transferase [Bacteroidales bacterium]
MTLLQITWDVSPVLFSLGPLSVRWYGLFWALSFYLGYEMISRMFKKEGVPVAQADRLLIYIALGSIIGARLGHCFFYDFTYFINNPIEIFKIWQGGLASHGGAIGILIALYLYQRKPGNKSFVWLLDRLVIPISLGAFFIRMGNLMNSEIYGYETTLPWGFIFVSAGETVAKHPTQFYEGIPYLLLFVALGWLYLKKRDKLRPAFLLSLFAIVMFTVRFLVEFVKLDQSAFEAGMVLNMGQLLSLPILIAGIIVMILIMHRPLVQEKLPKK